MRKGLIALLVVALAGPAFGQSSSGARVRVEGGTYARISPRELSEALRTRELVLVNVHVPYEGEIEGTDLLVPFDRIAAASALPRDLGAEIVVYCRSGAMSAVAAAALVRRGYLNVRELAGGFEAWRAVGYRLSSRRR